MPALIPIGDMSKNSVRFEFPKQDAEKESSHIDVSKYNQMSVADQIAYRQKIKQKNSMLFENKKEIVRREIKELESQLAEVDVGCSVVCLV